MLTECGIVISPHVDSRARRRLILSFFTVTSVPLQQTQYQAAARLQVNMWADHDTAFCEAWFCVDTNGHHSVTTGFTRFRLVTPSNCCP